MMNYMELDSSMKTVCVLGRKHWKRLGVLYLHVDGVGFVFELVNQVTNTSVHA
jgi:hypothetical protein